MRIPTPSVLTMALLGVTAGLPAAEEAPPPPRSGCPGLVAASAERGPFHPGQEEVIAEALQDERHGEALYSRVLETLGEVRPFSNIVHAERRHAAFLEDLLRSRDLPVPANRWTSQELPTYSSRQEACAAAVQFEVENVALYDRLLASGALPEDVKTVFQHNRRASLDHHRPAFARCAGTGSEPTAESVTSGRGGGGPDACGRGGHGCGCGARAQGHGGRGCGRGSCHAGGRRERRGRGGRPMAPPPAESGS
jgi:hypothetical protein